MIKYEYDENLFCCHVSVLIKLSVQIHAGECADRPGGGSGGQDK